MSMLISDVKEWLSQFPPDMEVGIDEGGICLIIPEVNACYEFGGIREDKEED